METVAPPEPASSDTNPEIDLLLARDPANDWRRWRVAGIVSAAVHIVLLTALLLMPESATELRIYEQRPVILVTPLYTPTDLTQKAPNKGKLSKMLTAEAIPERPKIKTPSPTAAARKRPAQAPLPAAAPQIAKDTPKVVIAEPPKIQAETQNPQQSAQIGKLNVPPPPQEQPKIVLENVAPPSQGNSKPGTQPSRVAMPSASVDAAIRDLTRSGVPGVQSVGDVGADEGFGAGLNLPPSAGRPHSNLELKSDPMGVDFRPYMLQVLAAVRRNWFAVYPEAARLGQRGEVVLEFAISKGGVVTKVIFSSESGMKALDQSAVAAISASNPLPPLPSDFKGDRIVLRMTFMYNIRR